MRFRLVVDGETHDIELRGEPPALTVVVDGAPYRTRADRDGVGFAVRIGQRRHRVAIRGRHVTVDGTVHEVSTGALEGGARATGGPEGSRSGSVLELRPPMPGRIVKLAVAAGDHVKRGQTLAVLEAMKMQNEIPAPAEGLVRSVGVREGETIGPDRVIAVLEVR